MSGAFAPANISLVFTIEEHNGQKGSCGVGFTLKEGVTVDAWFSDATGVFWNGKKISIGAVDSVISHLLGNQSRHLCIDIVSTLPLGCGFGLSGASALATAFVVDELLQLKKEKKDLALLAHRAEVEHHTGLGDVVNEFYGGFLLKTVPSYHFQVQKLNLPLTALHYRTFGPLETKAVITDPDRKNTIATEGHKVIESFQNQVTHLTIETLFTHAKEFAVQTGLADETIKKTITQIERGGGFASMIMLGRGVVATVPFEGSTIIHPSDQAAYVMR